MLIHIVVSIHEHDSTSDISFDCYRSRGGDKLFLRVCTKTAAMTTVKGTYQTVRCIVLQCLRDSDGAEGKTKVKMECQGPRYFGKIWMKH